MKEMLLEKINSWSIERAGEFHQDDQALNDYIWEYTEDGVGVFLYQELAAWYFDNRSGRVHRLHHRYASTDYETLEKLARYGALGEIRFDIPEERSFVLHADSDRFLEYTVYRRPNRELGHSFIENVVAGAGGKPIEEELKFYIEHTSQTIDIFLDLDLKFPLIGLTCLHLNVDQVGPFWMNLKTFELGYEDFLAKNLLEFKKDLIMHSDYFGKDFTHLYKLAEQSWAR